MSILPCFPVCSVRPRNDINETNDAVLIPFLLSDPWEPSWTMLLSGPRVHRYTSTARLLTPHPSLVPFTSSTARSLWCVHSHQPPQCFTITWRSHFSSIRERLSSKLLEEYNFLRFLLSSAFEFQGKGEKKKKKNLFGSVLLHQSCVPTAAAAAAVRERCHLYFLTAKISRASERQSLTPRRLH